MAIPSLYEPFTAIPIPTSVHVPILPPALLRLVTFYFFLVALYIAYRYFWLRPQGYSMARSPVVILNAFVFALLTLVYAQGNTTNSSTATNSSASTSSPTSSFRSIFTVPASADEGLQLLANIDDPQAVNAQSVCPGYTASNVSQTIYGFTADLTLNGTACNVYGTDVENLRLTVEYQSTDRLHVEITPTYLNSTNSSWFELPETLIPKPSINASAASTDVETDLQFSWSNDPTFSFTVTRRSTGDVLFTTNGTKIVFENQFIEFGSPLPENYNLYGLGEVIHGLRLGNNLTRTIYAADVGDPVDLNIYGSHPFYLDTRYFEVDASTGNLTYTANATNQTATYKSYAHGVYLRNAHGQEILLRPSNITWRTLGGNIDLYFYSGPTQKEVTQNYQLSAVGLPAMQQYWTFGFHQCRWGYQSWLQLQTVVDNFAKFDIPLETIWTDIDYMNQYRDFENDQRRFSYDEAGQFLSQLHANGQHYIPIVDSAIYVPNANNASDAYPTFDRGNASNSFMLNPDGSIYIGEVWPGYTAFPDWVGGVLAGGGAFQWWSDELKRYSGNISFDGIWIDMSEVSSFCVGSCGSNNLTLNPVHPDFQLPGEPGNVIYDYPEGFASTNASEAASVSAASSSAAASASAAAGPPPSSTSTSYFRSTPTPNVRNINYPPYVINHVQDGHDLAVHAVSPNATHHGGVVEYDVHNLFGHQILNATYHALLSISPTKRPFIIGRSTFAGSGKWAGHWGGDNASQFLYMLMSIPQALSFSLFGIPMFGVDTCGFNGNTDEELCNRWMQLSAFFPFYRNHNVLSAISQEPYVWASVAEASRKAMAIRYALLPYIYTTFYLSHTTGSTTMRALAWEFPDDPSLANADRQFLLGDSILVTPVLNQGATNVSGVFPYGSSDKPEIWYDWYTNTAVNSSTTYSQNITLDAPLGHIPVFIRGGRILPLQEPALTTSAARNTSWSLLVALDRTGSAQGSLYVDDGESLTPNATLVVEFLASGAKQLSVSVRGTYKDSNPLANVTVLGVKTKPSTVKFGSTSLAASGNGNSSTNANSTSSGSAAGGGSWTYNATSGVLGITGLVNLTSSSASASASSSNSSSTSNSTSSSSSSSGGAWAADWTLSWT